jgi:hypothetical protein
MSSLLYSADFQITPIVYNTVLNAVNLHLDGHQFSEVMLLPSLNSTIFDIGYERILNEDDMTLRQISQTSGFRFFLFKMNNNIYNIITNLDVSVVYKVTI